MDIITQINIFVYLSLFAFWTLFGSFSSVIIYRLKSGEKGIMTGRSHCGRCKTTLKALDLIPIFSWLIHRGKCAYCKKMISSVYPFLELSAGLLFAAIGYFLIDFTLILTWDFLEITKLLFWSTIGILSIIYIFYDILFLEIHEWVMATGIILTIWAVWIQTLFPEFQIFSHLASTITHSNLILGSALWLTGLIMAILYTIMLRGYDEKIDLVLLIIIIGLLIWFKYLFWVNLTDIVILNGLIWALSIFIFFFLQIFISKWMWLGWWDLRIALMIGFALWTSLVFPWMMLTYLSGTFLSLWYLAYSKWKHENKWFNTQIPFGPFLAIGFFITMFYQSDIINLMAIYF